MKNKIHLIDGIVVMLSLVILVFIGGNITPMAIAPLNNLETTESSVLFSIEKAEKILIDSSVEFNNPKEYTLKNNLGIELEPGEYYWQAVNSLGLKTEIKKLTVVSKIDLRLEETLEGYKILNGGNTKLNVDIYNDSELVDSINIVPYEEKQTSGNKFFARWTNG